MQLSWGLEVSSALQEAAERGDTPALRRLLLAYEEDVDARDHDGSTALHAAAVGGHLGAARLLLDAAADPNSRTNCGDTSLHFASREGHLEVARLLVQRGADAAATTRGTASDFGLAAPLNASVAYGDRSNASVACEERRSLSKKKRVRNAGGARGGRRGPRGRRASGRARRCRTAPRRPCCRRRRRPR